MEVDGHQNEESPNSFVTYLNQQRDWIEKTKGNLMIVATVIAAMSFQAMANPPGGVWQSDNCSEDQNVTARVCQGAGGTSVLEYSKRVFYLGIVITSTVSFSTSMSLILLLISGLRLRNLPIIVILETLMMVAVLCITAAFFFVVALVQFHDKIITYMLKIYLGFWIWFPALILLFGLGRLIVWLIHSTVSMTLTPLFCLLTKWTWTRV